MEHQRWTSKDGVTFTFRAAATRGDQSDMHMAMAEGMTVLDGKVIPASPLNLYPWIIKRFVTGWSLEEPWSYDALCSQPADPTEDLIMVLGAYVFNHVRGLTVTAKELELKNA